MKNSDDTHTPDLFGVSPGVNDNAALVAQPDESGRWVSTMSVSAKLLHLHKSRFDECCQFGLVASAARQRNLIRLTASRLIGAGL